MVTNVDVEQIPGDNTLAKRRDGWRMVKFGDVVRNVQINVDPQASGLKRYIAGEHMGTDDLHIRQWGTFGDGYLGPAFHRKFVKGQVLYGSRRTYLRKVAVADFDGICANTTFVLEPVGDELIPDLLPFIMQTEAFTQHSIKQSKGSVNPYINWKDIAWHEFALPPKDEQRRIADILWAVNKAIEKKNIVFQIMEATVDTIREEKFANTVLSKTTLADLCEPRGIQIGPFGSQLHASDYVNDGIPVIMPSDMIDDMVNESSIAKITPEMAESLAHHRVFPGDILLPRRGELDKRAFIHSNQAGWICGTGSIRIRIRDPKLVCAVFHALSSPQTITWLQEHAVGTTMPNLNAQIVSQIPITLPDEQEIDSIVQMLESLNVTTSLALENIEKLRQLKNFLLNTLLMGRR